MMPVFLNLAPLFGIMVVLGIAFLVSPYIIGWWARVFLRSLHKHD